MPKTIGNNTVVLEWQDVDWKSIERRVFRLQKRIHQAERRGDIKTVRGLQKLLLKSWSARMLAARRVTQDNQGKKTAGVDGVKSLSPKARMRLVGQLKLNSKAKPARRVWIPKPGRDEKRPLGIPTIYDRALQALVKMALEPQWEAKFEPNSYGFRPGRSCQDAIGAIFNAIRCKPKWVLDADIAKCFDRIDHGKLLDKLETIPAIRRQIRAWLKAGVIDSGQLFPTDEGTPQGGVISPLLANIALHGMEESIKELVEQLPGKGSRTNRRRAVSLIRYADDFVIIHENLGVIEKCRDHIQEWLKGMGLELKEEKNSYHSHSRV
ncbi:reverse transcriptase domain-containing protein [Limnospira indica]|nr:reverse transcriptase domain-containing protein [Limnospira indica]QNH59773.1 MAG: reverse transcriptase N-terminal domain-containing protein [Limnospira indica BM01]